MVKYATYINSLQWQHIRSTRIYLGINIGGKPVCEWCRQHAAKQIEVHHLTYDRLGREKFADLMVVCSGCHWTLEQQVTALVESGLTRKAAMEQLRPMCMQRIQKTFEVLRCASN